MSHYDGFVAESGPVLKKAITGSSTSNTLVAAVSGFSIRVLAFKVTVTSAATANLQDNSGTPVEIDGPSPLSDNGGYCLPFCPYGWGDTGVGKQLDLILSVGSTFGGSIVYQLIKST